MHLASLPLRWGLCLGLIAALAVGCGDDDNGTPANDTDNLESADENPETADENPETADETPEAADETPEAADETPADDEEAPEAADDDEAPEAADETPADDEEAPEAADETPADDEEAPEAADETPADDEEAPEAADETAEDDTADHEMPGDEPEGESEAPGLAATIGAAGGALEQPGVFRLTVPAGALSADTTITATVSDPTEQTPFAGQVLGHLIDLGPNGQVFAQPVSLRIDIHGTVPEGKRAVMAWLNGQSWEQLSDSATEGGAVTATTTHFTVFALVLVDAPATGPACEAHRFTPCGGTLLGTYELVDGCMDRFQNPYAQTCPASSIESALMDGTTVATFGADGSYSSEIQARVHLTVRFPKTCLPPTATCDYLSQGLPAGSSVSDQSDYCRIQAAFAPPAQQTVGTFTVNGGSITIAASRPGGTPNPDTGDFCVTGDSARLHFAGDSESDSEVWYQIRKVPPPAP